MLVGLRPSGPEPAWTAWEFSPVEDAEEILLGLLEDYWEGLVRPLHFFPRCSWEYAQMILKQVKPEEDALRKVHNTWTGSDYQPGECKDVYYQLCFANVDPLDSEFQQIATETLGPLLKSQNDFVI
jgi:exodeoxyribonuclease V gamma subunit